MGGRIGNTTMDRHGAWAVRDWRRWPVAKRGVGQPGNGYDESLHALDTFLAKLEAKCPNNVEKNKFDSHANDAICVVTALSIFDLW